MSSLLEVLNPVSISHGSIESAGLASRTASLDGKNVGLLWNSKPGGDIALARVGELIQTRFKNVQLIQLNGGIGTNQQLIESAKKECHFAVGSAAD